MCIKSCSSLHYLLSFPYPTSDQDWKQLIQVTVPLSLPSSLPQRISVTYTTPPPGRESLQPSADVRLMITNFIDIWQMGLLFLLLLNPHPLIATFWFKMPTHLNGIVKLQTILGISRFFRRGGMGGPLVGDPISPRVICWVDHFNSQPSESPKLQKSMQPVWMPFQSTFELRNNLCKDLFTYELQNLYFCVLVDSERYPCNYPFLC